MESCLKFEIGQIVERTIKSIVGSGQWIFIVLGEGDYPQRLKLYCLKSPERCFAHGHTPLTGDVVNINTFYLREYKNES